MDYRKMDTRRRITIPVELRSKLNLNENELIELRIEYGKIVVKKAPRTSIKTIPIIGAVKRLDSRGGFVIPKHYVEDILPNYTNKFNVSLNEKDSTITFKPIYLG